MIIIDAVNFLFRSYYALGVMTNEKGESTQALYGFIRSVEKLLRDFPSEAVVAVFDGPENKERRRAIFADYKAHRAGAPLDLFHQFEWAEKWCSLRGIPTLCVQGVEADDAMASVARFAHGIGWDVFLCTSDKDLAQMVGERISLLQVHKNNQIIDAKGVEELFGVRPDQMVDYLALMGDPSDNIPGIAGIGPKTAVALLQTYDTLDAILAHAKEISGKKGALLQEGKDQALLSHKLALLDTAVPVPQDPDFYRQKGGKQEELAEFYRRFQFHSLLPKQKTEEKETTEHLVENSESWQRLLNALEEAPEICMALETEGDLFSKEYTSLSFSLLPGESWKIPGGSDLQPLRLFFQKKERTLFGHNLKPLLHFFATCDIPAPRLSFDTEIASYLLYPHKRAHDLEAIALERWGYQLTGPLAEATFRLRRELTEELKEKKLELLLQEMELPLIPVLTEMERAGIYLDQEPLKAMREKLLRDIAEWQEKIFRAAGEEFNLNSPKQLSHILFEKLLLPPPSRKKGHLTTSAQTLEELAEDHPIAKDILAYRSLEKLRSTYVDALPAAIHPQTGRIHCTFSQSVAATGRLSSLNPNLQNIPIRSPEGLLLRAAFRPGKESWSYIAGDYSQIELRLLAHFSEDPDLLKAFQEGEDIHKHTAARMYHLPLSEITPAMRAVAKTVNFGILYGQTAFGLSKQLHIPLEEATSFINTYFQRYPKVQGFLENCKESARKTGRAITLSGRQRPIPELGNPNPSIRAAAERLAINTPLQGTAADMIKLAMISLQKAIKEENLKGKMILQIHDELLFEVPDSELLRFKELIKEKMETVLPLRLPIIAEIAVGKNWAECYH
ncbi:MAG: DNA polymerase I [Verrucomicrobiota bacterium]|nr:DNA polymerase I [Verrucomicrobiota bacterium]